MDTNKLKELAERAHPYAPVDWFVENGMDQVRDCEDGFVCETGEDEPIKAEYIAAANPTTILELIAEVERLRKDAERYRWLKENCDIDYRGNLPHELYESTDAAIDAALEGGGR
ncbi:hypothetical protein I5I61_09660 [Pseudomonas nitroreducens]|uniref:Ead/Ea22-like family protein n=1 Tax=Pseudomonas nitroreducens TaxID=46680 RepID=A0ABS0KID0_PSENT|nr:hypothetical protein [Pseudomonas nitroreducens]MBG6287709.1 hypothetical protein [Pseudomonas nitroreducens]